MSKSIDHALADWLRNCGIDPSRVPAHSRFELSVSDGDVAMLSYDEIQVDSRGNPLIRSNARVISCRTVELTVTPPLGPRVEDPARG